MASYDIGLVVLIAISLFVCPLAAGGFGLGGAASIIVMGFALCPETGGGGCVAAIVVALGYTGQNFVRAFFRVGDLNGQLEECERHLAGRFLQAQLAGEP